MKQVININFQGRVVPIEVTAFEVLKNYTESLNRHFAAEEGKEEIINDIENRIGELFQERLTKGSTCITDEDVNAIIASMGRPEDFDSADAGTSEQYKRAESTPPPFQAPGTGKRLFRDENDKVIGGVCSGLANYFGIDVVVVRIVFVVLAVSFGVGLIPYLILWIAVPSSASTVIGSTRKKLYRDPDNKFIAGVCSGIANYFGINVWIPRVLFLLPFLSFAGRNWGNDFSDIFRLGFSPGSLIVYIILWLVIPEASSTTEKLEMKGEKVDMNSIKNSVMEEMKGVQQRAQKLGSEAKTIAQEKGKAFGAEVGGVARRSGRSLGDVIALLFKIFAYFILGCIAFAFIAALFGFGIVSIGLFPMKDFLLTDGWQNALAWGTLLFFIATPIIGIITWIIRRLAKIKTRRKTLRLTFVSLWLIGVICFISLITSVGRDFRNTNTMREEEVALDSPGIRKLEITSTVPDQKFYRNNWFNIQPFLNMDEDTAYVRNVSIHIIKSSNDSFRVTMLKMVNGRNRRSADTLAAIMNFNVSQKDSLLLIDKGIAITRKDKFRNQRIIITVYVPVGKQIRVDRSTGWGQNVHFEGPWRDDWDIEFNDVEQGWDRDVDYIMKSDGLYTLDGEPADTWKHPRNGNKKNFRVTIDDDNVNVEDDNYRYDSSKNMTPLDSLRRKLQLEQKRTKDSLQKVRDKIEDQLQRIEDKSNEPTAYVLPSYNPMLIMN
ncbi:MAG TPA: PspC domain-containing protein [Ferruginibacter sp.]|nr:PspC domain-containing protein [Ferruginibacter sp.]